MEQRRSELPHTTLSLCFARNASERPYRELEQYQSRVTDEFRIFCYIIMITFIRQKMSDNTKPRQTRERTDIYMQIKREFYS